MFMRFHNYLASSLQKINPSWSDEKLYQESRKINIAVEQIAIYRDYIPILLGTYFHIRIDVWCCLSALYISLFHNFYLQTVKLPMLWVKKCYRIKFEIYMAVKSINCRIQITFVRVSSAYNLESSINQTHSKRKKCTSNLNVLGSRNDINITNIFTIKFVCKLKKVQTIPKN